MNDQDQVNVGKEHSGGDAELSPFSPEEGLLPCPWCGGRATLTMYSQTLEPDDSDPYPLHVHCDEDNDCAVRPDVCGINKDDAITRWNTRAPAGNHQAADDRVHRYVKGLLTGHRDEAKLLIPVIKQLCRDLNDAHNEILREQGVSSEEFGNYDWPEWTPQANSIRWAEGILKTRLAKTNNWTLYPVALEINAPANKRDNTVAVESSLPHGTES